MPQGWRSGPGEIADPVEQYEAMTAVAKPPTQGPWDSIWVYDHFHTVPHPTINTTFECWTITADPGPRHQAGQRRADGRLQRLSQPRAVRQDRLDRRRRQPRPPLRRDRRRLVRARVEGVRLRVARDPGADGAFREARRRSSTRCGPRTSRSFTGKHYTIDKPINEPKGVRKPHPPLWIGGGGEQVTLKLVAQYGDACNVGGGDPELIRHKLDVLRGHCDKVGRDYDEIIKSSQIRIHLIEPGEDPEKASAQYRGNHYTWERYQSEMLVGTIDQVRSEVERLIEDGIDYLIIYIAKAAYEPALVQYVSDEVVKKYA